jgi:hypothetical protein
MPITIQELLDGLPGAELRIAQQRKEAEEREAERWANLSALIDEHPIISPRYMRFNKSA